MKKLFTIMLSFILSLCLPATTAIAAENTNPELIRHTAELTIEPGEETILSNGDYGVMPAIWNQNSYTVPVNTVTYVPLTIPDRYFAFEVSALNSNGSATNQPFYVELLCNVTGVELGLPGIANGTVYKEDWIDTRSTCTYQLKLYNQANCSLNFLITYYSWA